MAKGYGLDGFDCFDCFGLDYLRNNWILMLLNDDSTRLVWCSARRESDQSYKSYELYKLWCILYMVYYFPFEAKSIRIGSR
jgi:hypothetical protein